MFRLCSLVFLLAGPAFADTLSGPIRVIDADTIDIGATANIRLSAIDAAEGAQTCWDGPEELPCGRMATEAARHLYQGRWAQCQMSGWDRYDRILAVCEVDGVDMNRELVRLGLARSYRGNATYAEAEKEAVLLERGLWAYEMDAPWIYRDMVRVTQAGDMAPVVGTCPIKGNISSNGRIYHLPGQDYYQRTRIDPARGERWFCSEGEARAAGWRRAGR